MIFRDETHLDLISEEYEQIYGRESFDKQVRGKSSNLCRLILRITHV